MFSNTIQQEELNKKRSDLINELGDNLTPAQILYSTVDELENLKENNNSKTNIDNLTFKTKDDDKKIYKNGNQYFIKDEEDKKDKEEFSLAEVLYGKRKNKEKDEEKPTGGASNVYMTPIEELYERNKEDKKNMTPIDELYERKKGYCDNPNYKIDNSYFSENAIKKAREFIQGKEDFKSDAYIPLKGDRWTIGYGHTKGVKQGDRITREEAEKLYREDFKEHSNALKAVKVSLSDNQKVALASFAFNIGPSGFKNSDVVKILNTGDYKGAAEELLKYNKSKGRFSQGLYNRRKKERELFLTPDD